jgi:hypothetical protein
MYRSLIDQINLIKIIDHPSTIIDRPNNDRRLLGSLELI